MCGHSRLWPKLKARILIVVDQLSPELKEPTDKELQPLSQATYKGNLGKLELLVVLREGVLYLGTLSA